MTMYDKEKLLINILRFTCTPFVLESPDFFVPFDYNIVNIFF